MARKIASADMPVGTRFDKRVVLGSVFHAALGNDKRRRGYVVAECGCGNVDVVLTCELLAGKQGRCIYCRETRPKSHGHVMNKTRSPTYTTWLSMRARVFNRNGNCPSYAAIDIDPRWDESFEAFYADVGDRPHLGLSIDRIDNSKGYWPGNVMWSSRKKQNRNTSRTVHVTHQGVTKSIAEWAEMYGLAYQVLRSRLRLGWSVEDALTVPVGSCRKYSNLVTF